MKRAESLLVAADSRFCTQILSKLLSRKPFEIVLIAAFQINVIAFSIVLMASFGLGVREAGLGFLGSTTIIIMNAAWQWRHIKPVSKSLFFGFIHQFLEDSAVLLLLIINFTAAEKVDETAAFYIFVSALFFLSALSIKPFVSFFISKILIFVLALAITLQSNHYELMVSGKGFGFIVAFVLLLAFGYWMYIRQVRTFHLGFEQNELQAMLSDKNHELAIANRLQKRMTHHIGHDLRQPINSINYALHSIATNPKPEALKTSLTLASSSVDVANYLIEEILASVYYKNYDTIRLSYETFEANSILDLLLREFLTIVEISGGSLHRVKCSASLQSDPQIIARILRNLLSNAARYARGSRIVLGARRKPEHLIFQVIDNGPGIEPGLQQYLFDEFTAGEKSLQEGGLGLGLNIAKNLTRLLNGNLLLQSTPGKGTAFSLVVPLKPHIHSEQATLQ